MQKIKLFLFAFSLLFAFSPALTAQTNEGAAIVEALRLRSTGNTAEALALLREAAANRHFILRDYSQFEIGETYFNLGNYPPAVKEYQKLIAENPASLLLPRALLMAGKANLNLKNYPSAIRTFRDLVKNHPEAKETASTRFLIGKALHAQGKWKEAYLAFEETDLYHPLSFFGKKARLEIRALKKAHRKALPRFKASAAALFKKGMSYFEQDDFEMAANVFNLLAREYPRSKLMGEAWLMLGRAEMQTRRFPTAISNLEKAAEGASALAGRAHYYLGLAHARQGFYAKAIVQLRKVLDGYPDSGLADEAAYWIAYYQEQQADASNALLSYYNLISKYPNSSWVPTSIWRIGRIYYWNSEFKNAATYLHMAQLYPAGEDSPRCYFFEAKALERLGNREGALEVYKKLVQKFDHTYYAYRAQEKLAAFGISSPNEKSFNQEEFSAALNDLDGKDPEELSAIMEIWEQTNGESLNADSSLEVRSHLDKYKELLRLGLASYAADEARYLVSTTSDMEKDSARTKLAETLTRVGEYKTPIRFADRKVRSAVIAGKPNTLTQKIWQMAYPKGYWKYVSDKSNYFKVDPFLVLALIREESRFNPKATSRSGARGLMQIMPRTGKGIAKNLALSRYRTRKLYDPALNVQMGVYYLSDLIDRFDGNIFLSLAGYNGGPNKIKRYLKSWYNGDLKLVDVDDFVESIPTRETRLYVQKVMGSYFEYKRLYDRKRTQQLLGS